MVVTFIMTNNTASAATAPAENPVIITINGGNESKFVTKNEIERLIAPHLPSAGKPIVTARVNTLAMARTLNSVDNIEWARCSHTSTGRLKIEVTPMTPVARVFDGDSSYYINRQGKCLTASLRYRSDVPVIQGHINDASHARSLLPLIDTITSRSELSQLITSIKIEPDGDVMLIPALRGHVVKFGAPDEQISNKMQRLLEMYRQVMPVKGWDFYDTISVKFSNRIIAHRCEPRQRHDRYRTDPEGEEMAKRSVPTYVLKSEPVSESAGTVKPVEAPQVATESLSAPAESLPAPAEPLSAPAEPENEQNSTPTIMIE